VPTYAYRCGCATEWDVIKSVASIDDPEPCPKCKELGSRQIVAVNFNGASDWNSQTWNPALGCYTRNTRHARQLAKARGMEEVGTEPPEKIHAKFERDKEDARAARWEDAMRDKVYGD